MRADPGGGGGEEREREEEGDEKEEGEQGKVGQVIGKGNPCRNDQRQQDVRFDRSRRQLFPSNPTAEEQEMMEDEMKTGRLGSSFSVHNKHDKDSDLSIDI